MAKTRRPRIELLGLHDSTKTRRPRIELLGLHDSASPAEAAAIVAALERFMRDTALAQQGEEADRWRQAALLEGVSREPGIDVPDSWINT